jgi:hypothetical protein
MENSLIRKRLPEIIGAIVGAAGGFLYWKYVGCVSGTCAIKSNWYLMVPWGMLLGYLAGSLIGDIFRKRRAPEKKEEA